MIHIKEEKRKQIVQGALHFLLWGFLFCFPLFFAEDNPRWQGMLQRHWLALTFSALIFYIDYFFLVDRFLMRRKVGGFVLFNIALILVCLFALESIHEVTVPQPPLRGGPPPRFPRGMSWFRQSSFFLLAICICVAVKLTIRWYEAEAQRKKNGERTPKVGTHLPAVSASAALLLQHAEQYLFAGGAGPFPGSKIHSSPQQTDALPAVRVQHHGGTPYQRDHLCQRLRLPDATSGA